MDTNGGEVASLCGTGDECDLGGGAPREQSAPEIRPRLEPSLEDRSCAPSLEFFQVEPIAEDKAKMDRRSARLNLARRLQAYYQALANEIPPRIQELLDRLTGKSR